VRAALRGVKGDVIVDLSGVTFIDASGLTELVVAARQIRAWGCRFVTTNEPPTVARLLRVTRLDRLFHPQC
jgi:anti-anti-sigma factor